MTLKTVAAALVAGAFAVAVYFGYGLMAGSAPLSESGLQRHLTAVIDSQAGVPIDQVGNARVDQVAAFHTALKVYRSAQFTGYDIVLSGFDAATCNQIMKSPWVENAASAKSLTTTCGDPKAEIHLLMAAK
jgi:hypothetical protein